MNIADIFRSLEDALNPVRAQQHRVANATEDQPGRALQRASGGRRTASGALNVEEIVRQAGTRVPAGAAAAAPANPYMPVQNLEPPPVSIDTLAKQAGFLPSAPTPEPVKRAGVVAPPVVPKPKPAVPEADWIRRGSGISVRG